MDENESRIMNLIIASNMNMHPLIKGSKLSQKDKIILQSLLDDEFEGDINKLIEDMMHYAVDEELYELAATIRDFLKEENI
jgi:hypothetical protein